MPDDPISVTTRRSWFSRLGAAFGGVLTGLALLAAALLLLTWNEGRSVQSIRANTEGAGAVIEVRAEVADPGNAGHLVHVSGPVHAEGRRLDPDVGISTDALVMTRKVQYFQWIETRRSETRTRLGGGEETVTTFSYDQQWTDTPQDSASFHQPVGHANPAPVLKNADFKPDRAQLGAYNLGTQVLEQVHADAPLTLSAEQVAEAARKQPNRTHAVEGGLFVGVNPDAPRPGDMRLTYSVARQGGTYSVIGAQGEGAAIGAFRTRAGAPLLMVHSGTVAAEKMFDAARSGNQILSWVLRVLGVILMMAGFGMVLGPLGVLADVVPIVGSIVRAGTGMVATLAGTALSMVVIATSWLVFRPVVGLALLAIAAVLAGVLIWLGRRRRGAPATTLSVSPGPPAS